eukprot:TRINITY_DN24983_c0_g2_i2.p1 TRINITY_DN24983_c0_g2~~TRINITY_DN24983_c0_g2_i2.p1  ORF type:complete len:389 (+),score=95.88 TRINITY_DN24983_c0_g2_i2:27-1169(+)
MEEEYAEDEEEESEPELFVSPKMELLHQTRKAKELFRFFDPNDSGVIGYRGIKMLLRYRNPTCNEAQLGRLFEAIDANGDGQVTIEEFCEFFISHDGNLDVLPKEEPKKPPRYEMEKWKIEVLDSHNERRSLHETSKLEWSQECYEHAKKQANACQAKGALFHGNRQGRSGLHGQNIFVCQEFISKRKLAEAVIGSWYNQYRSPGYDFKAPGLTEGTEQFSQIVWRGTTHVGMAASDDGTYVVANYLPAGNAASPDAFEANVGPPAGTAAFYYKKREPTRPKQKEVVDSTAAKKEELPPDSQTSCRGKKMKELKAFIDGCTPFMRSKIETAFANDASSVTVERSFWQGTLEKPPKTRFKVSVCYTDKSRKPTIMRFTSNG